jgi:hypothetical protein
MPAGLQIFDASGNLIIDYSTRVGRFIGSFATGGAISGSITDTSIIGRVFLHYTPGSGIGVYGGPEVTANTSSGVISWNYTQTTAGGAAGGTSADRQHTVYYGAY